MIDRRMDIQTKRREIQTDRLIGEWTDKRKRDRWTDGLIGRQKEERQMD